MATITDSIGRVLAGRYRIESGIGSGTSAHVFAARDVTLQRRVALKVLHPALTGDQAFLRRFRAEAQAAASLSHPNVLAVYDWGEDDNGPFLVLEYLGGGSLRDVLDEGRRLSLSQAVAVGVQAAEGLAYAHGRGFVHRDIKPANLLFGEDERLRIGDFGLARALAEAAYTEPVGATVGTARYAAPEQAQGRPVDGRADVYSLALVLYEAVTGVVPFAADTTLATLMGRVGARLPGHDGLGPLADILQQAAEPEAGQRLDAAAFAGRLRALVDRLPAPERLPLVGPMQVGTNGGRSLAPDERTMAPGSHAVSGGATSGGSELGDVFAVANAVGVATDRGQSTRLRSFRSWWPLHRRAGASRPDRRRNMWMALAAVLVLLLGGSAYAVVAAKVFVPSHPLPVVTGLSTSAARARLVPDHLTLRITGRHSSVSVAAGHVIREIPGAGTALKEGSVVEVVVSTGPPPVTVPSLAAVTTDCAGAETVLQSVGFKVSCTHQSSMTVQSGSVVDWSPKGHAPLGSTIAVVVSSGPPIVSIPSLTGSTCQGATTTLQAIGLVIQCQNTYSMTVPNGQVVSWSPTGQAPEGSTVAVQISQGPPPVTVPAIYGHTVSDAIGMLQAVGLVPGTDQGPLSGRVFASDPAQGAVVPEGTTVTLYSK